VIKKSRNHEEDPDAEVSVNLQHIPAEEMPGARKVREQDTRQGDGAQAIQGRNSTAGVQRQLPDRDLPVLGEDFSLTGIASGSW
jgi:hypothetical protein